MGREQIDAVVASIHDKSRGLGEVRLMEVCGTHTVSLFRSGVRSMLPPNVKLLSGPGCPVCVTAQNYIDAACALAGRPGLRVATYGDMVRVPGHGGSLAERRADGAQVQVVYSALDAVKAALAEPERETVFLAVGFETTTPATAAALLEAKAKKIRNFSVLPAHKLVVPAMLALLSGGASAVSGFLCPGHVSVIIGSRAYAPIVERHRAPCVVAGFEPLNMLQGIEALLAQLAEGRVELCNVYGAAVGETGNAAALELIDRVFEPAPAEWRALGEIPDSGLELRPEFREFDARERHGIAFGPEREQPGCLCGEVIQGRAGPTDCGLFGEACTPMRPVGPCMVSSEGSCAAHYKYGRPTTAGQGERP